MKKLLILAGLLFCLLLSACAPSVELPATDGSTTETLDLSGSSDILPEIDLFPAIYCSFYDHHLTETHLSSAQPPEMDGELMGGIVPHYAPAMYLTAELLAARSAPPDTIVVIAPNHAAENGNIQICGASYEWNGGSMSGNRALAESLTLGLGLEQDDRAAREDWSASLQIPYLAHFFPETQVVTIMLSRGADPTMLAVLGELLAEAAREETLFFLASVDFSHEQTPEQAQRCDETTHRLIAAGDSAALLRLGNDHLDSPESILLMLHLQKAFDGELSLSGSHVETFLENGRQMAGSYYAYALKTGGGEAPVCDPCGEADDQNALE